MSDKNFDKEIALLYQQRKQEINEPVINLSRINTTKKNRYSVLQILNILFLGGAASFGILAMISHLSAQKMTKPEGNTGIPLTVVELKEKALVPDEPVIVIQAALAPKKPLLTPPNIEQEEVVETQKLLTDLGGPLTIDVVNILPLPSIVQPTLSLVPIYQVLPKYTVKANKTDQVGIVKLSYGITASGQVYGISIDESSVSRELDRAAKKALSKWRYQPDKYEQERYEIIFDFTLHEKK